MKKVVLTCDDCQKPIEGYEHLQVQLKKTGGYIPRRSWVYNEDLTNPPFDLCLECAKKLGKIYDLYKSKGL